MAKHSIKEKKREAHDVDDSGGRQPNPVDVHVGIRIRMRRSLLGISQEKLAEAVNLTFQQIQKYERGTNRVSASRLYQFSKILDVPVSYFFEKFSESGDGRMLGYTGLSDNDQEQIIDDDRLHSKETLELVRAYYAVTDAKSRRELLKTIKSMADILQAGK
ncbi:MAG: helix-turn-helix transcriptional regulator [Alphaproteobacteria bacterium]|nr:helix-turn-helix transcriptional regulator [Alphaproteobacteria bacterium]